MGPVVEVRQPGQSVVWHVYWNHVDGLGAACRAQSGCFTIAPSQVTCRNCLSKLEEEK